MLCIFLELCICILLGTYTFISSDRSSYSNDVLVYTVRRQGTSRDFEHACLSIMSQEFLQSLSLTLLLERTSGAPPELLWSFLVYISKNIEKFLKKKIQKGPLGNP